MLQAVLLYDVGRDFSQLSAHTDSGWRAYKSNMNIFTGKNHNSTHLQHGHHPYAYSVQKIFVLEPHITQRVNLNSAGKSFSPVLQTFDIVHRNVVDTVIHMLLSEKDSQGVMSGGLAGNEMYHHDQSISFARAYLSYNVT
jgi:hypothetical protein